MPLIQESASQRKRDLSCGPLAFCLIGWDGSVLLEQLVHDPRGMLL